MKTFIVSLLILVCIATNAQRITLTGGKTLVPGIYTGLRYSHYTNSEINISGGLFLENANLNTLRYRAYGIEVLGEYGFSEDPDESIFAFKAGLGGTAEIDTELWVYKNWPLTKRINYGIISELSSTWNMTQVFALSAFAQQKFLFNKILGTTHFLFGASLSYRLSQ
jgi:hypothetical protein